MIELDGISVATGDVRLLSPVSVRVAAGQALVVRGDNGAGKSTLLRVITGSLAATEGAVRIAGVGLDERDPGFRRRVAAMIGLPPLAPDLTVFDHVLLVAATWEGNGAAARSHTRGVIAELGLERLSERFPHELSSGQTQLVGLAITLVRPFEVLVVDEPEQRLDDERVGMVGRALCARRDAGATLVVATHDDALAEAIADRTLVLERVA